MKTEAEIEVMAVMSQGMPGVIESQKGQEQTLP